MIINTKQSETHEKHKEKLGKMKTNSIWRRNRKFDDEHVLESANPPLIWCLKMN